MTIEQRNSIDIADSLSSHLLFERVSLMLDSAGFKPT